MLMVMILWFCIALWWMSDLILKPKHLSCELGFRMEAKLGKFSREYYEKTRKTRFSALSDFGYLLSCELLEPPTPLSNRVAILSHGFSHSKYGSLIYAEIFLQLGYRVIIYDHRNHGLSGKAYTSMGYYEKYDLKNIVDWCVNHFGPEPSIVTHGESMGAATVLLHLEIDQRVSCVIADCAYSDLKELLKHQLRTFYHVPVFLIPIESLITYLRAGFWYREVSPIKIVSRTKVPILFIHGKRDDYVPTRMSKQMYACKQGKKAIYLVAKAAHAQSCIRNRSGYTKRVEEFLAKHVK